MYEFPKKVYVYSTNNSSETNYQTCDGIFDILCSFHNKLETARNEVVPEPRKRRGGVSKPRKVQQRLPLDH